MSQTLERVRELAAEGQVLVSEHGYDELSADSIPIEDVLASLAKAVVIEDYPDYPKGPCVLLLQRDSAAGPVHVLWGIPRGKIAPAVIITAYRPEPQKWSKDFKRRLK